MMESLLQIDILGGFAANPVLYLSIVIPLLIILLASRGMVVSGVLWGSLTAIYVITTAEVPVLSTIVWVVIPLLSIYLAFDMYTKFVKDDRT